MYMYIYIGLYIYIYVYATFSGGISFGSEQPLESFVVRKKVRRVHAYSRQQKFIHGACDIEVTRGRVSVVFDRVSCGRSYSAGTRSRAYASVSSPRRQRANPRAPIRKAGKVRVNGWLPVWYGYTQDQTAPSGRPKKDEDARTNLRTATN